MRIISFAWLGGTSGSSIDDTLADLPQVCRGLSCPEPPGRPGPSVTGPPGADTNSPGGAPCDCSKLRACSRIATAAAPSINCRCSLARFPLSESRWEAVTVVSRSSTSRTGIFAPRQPAVPPAREPCRRRSLGTTQAARKADAHLDRLVLRDHIDQLRNLTCAGPNGGHRIGQHSVRVTRCNTYPRVTPVKAQSVRRVACVILSCTLTHLVRAHRHLDASPRVATLLWADRCRAAGVPVRWRTRSRSEV
mgnify:CR=1 FL=1